jgi:autoinducer 2-degrading protein
LSKFILQGFIIVPSVDLETILRELPNHIELSRKESGCLIFEVTQDNEDKHKFHVYEEFTNRDSFDRHQERVQTSNWGAVTRNVKRYYETN